MGGGQLPVQVNILGPDMARLQELNDQMMAAIKDVPGLVDLKSSLEGRKPEYVIEVDRDLARQRRALGRARSPPRCGPSWRARRPRASRTRRA